MCSFPQRFHLRRLVLTSCLLAGFTGISQAVEVPRQPIRIVYVNHVEVESVIDYTPPLADSAVSSTTTARYSFTSGQLEWEMALAESVGGSISFHMSGAYAEQALFEGDSSLWASHLLAGHTVGVHAHSFTRGLNPFEWVYNPQATQAEKELNWQDNYDLVGALVGTGKLLIGESHYSCPSCWVDLGYSLKTTEAMAKLPAGQHIVWLVERGPDSIVTYPHFPQIGQSGWHGPTNNRIFFDLRVPQLKKEFLMLYLEWLERERLNLEPQVWCWGWLNHGGPSTQLYGAEIQEILSWLSENFVGTISPRGNLVAEFVSDHQIKQIYEDYKAAGGQPMPSPLDSINDQFPYMDTALADAGVTADLSVELGLSGIRLFEMEIDPPEDQLSEPLSKVYLLFREKDGVDTVDITAVLAAQGVFDTNLILTDVMTGGYSQVIANSLIVDSIPMVLRAAAPSQSGDNSPFGFHPASVVLPGYPDNGYIDAANIGIKWTRQGVYAFWFLVQPDTGQQVYDFSLYDQQWSAVPDEINILANIAPEDYIDEGYTLPGSFLPIDSAKYCNFVKATVERYDGDSISDMPGLTNPIKYWQVGNEPSDILTSDFASLQKMTYVAIKEACPDCQVLVGGVAGMPEGYIQQFDVTYAPILTELAGQYVDILDFHWYGAATGEYRDVEAAFNHIRDTMNALGFSPSLPFWITEMGAYSGDPVDFGPLVFPYQTEQEQAADYLKRYVHSISLGVAKVFCAFGLAEGFHHDDGYFDHTGLIYDGLDSGDLGLGKKKSGYFAYQKMTSILEGCDWDSTEIISTGVANVYAYRFVRNDSSIYVAWWDYFDDPSYSAGDSIQFSLSGLNWLTATAIEAVPYDTFSYAFTEQFLPVSLGTVAVPLKESPVYLMAVVQSGCCGSYTGGQTGNANCDTGGKRNLADIARLIDKVYLSKLPLCCPENGNTNGDPEAKVNLADITRLVDHVYLSKGETAPCE